jgi:hypothetical protein
VLNMKMGAPLLTTDLSGSVGGLTASKARGGVRYFRARVRPSNPRSPDQSRQRLIQTGLAAAWRNDLSDTERATWTALAKPGESGIDVYVKVNSQLLIAGATRVDTAGDSATLDVAQLSTFVLDASANSLTLTCVDFSDDNYVNIFLEVKKQKSSRLSRQFSYRFAVAENLDTAGAHTYVLDSFFPPGYLATGDVLYARFVQFHVSGKVAIPQEARIVVTA